ncbi:hypothetical protein K435DRAFT_961781 [Dendrothele bispora CBS 962.96]|uniref:DUF6533 domain-containing protein n=1 Tax=Dendrothele bispora (strain CBS 962.96) TaxID=1314807 RepID=A0A4S8MQB1_DENBC|nr:hypothetical protein K435DRAFT_961781 [Dendrothele bispora CBS 962.96]
MNEWSWREIVAFRWSVSATAVYVWDLVSTIGIEYRLIWQRPFGRHKILYFWSRLFGLAGLLVSVYLQTSENSQDCMKQHRLRFSMIQLSMTVTQLLTLHQTFILYKRSRRIVIFFAFVVLVTLVFQSTGTAFHFQYLEMSADGCQRTRSRPMATVAYTMGSVCLQIVVLVMSCIRWRQIVNFSPDLRAPAIKLARVISRDNIVVSFFIILFVICSTVFGLVYGVSQSIWDYGWSWVFALLNMAPYRMILNLRQAQFESENEFLRMRSGGSLQQQQRQEQDRTWSSSWYSGTELTEIESDSAMTLSPGSSTSGSGDSEPSMRSRDSDTCKHGVINSHQQSAASKELCL